MNIQLSSKAIGLYGLSGIILGLILLFALEEYFISQVLIVSGLVCLLMLMVSTILKRYQSCQVLGLIVVLFSIINGLRHWAYLPVLFDFEELKEGEWYFIRFYIQELVWLLASVIVVLRGLDLLMIGNRIDYVSFQRTRRYKVLKWIVIVIICLEVPIWGMHYDFGGGLHGHSLWDGGTHFH